ncbi:MAG: hypothetical protein NTW54_05180 [Bacteroidetes bacterium]|nr:hypothetical protein [Bacteroidota bacterium]
MKSFFGVPAVVEPLSETLKNKYNSSQWNQGVYSIFYFGRGNEFSGIFGFDSLFLGEEVMELGVEGKIGEVIANNIVSITKKYKSFVAV